MDNNLRYQAAKRITLLGAALNILLSAIKIIFGWLGQSHALLADGVHSLADLLSDGMVVLAAHYGNQAADSNHPYGHKRIETAAMAALAVLLLATGVAIIYDAIEHLYYNNPHMPELIVLWIAIGSVIANELLFYATRRIARQTESALLEAQAWHRRSDAASSLIVVFGVAATLLGYTYLDAIAAIIVGLLIIHMAVKLGWRSVSELVDTSIDAEALKNIQHVILQTPGVRTIHQLRTRQMANNILVDVHVLVDPYLSVSEGHFISQKIHTRLMQAVSAITDVTVHIDPEDDEIAPTTSPNLPARDVLITTLHKLWQGLPGADQILWMYLHYLSGKIQIDVVLPLTILQQYKMTATELMTSYQVTEIEPTIARVQLFFTEHNE